MQSLIEPTSIVMLAAEDAVHAVPGWITAIFGLILAGMIAALALEEKIHAKKSIIVGSFAGLCLILATVLKLLTFGEVELPDHHMVSLPIYICLLYTSPSPRDS